MAATNSRSGNASSAASDSDTGGGAQLGGRGVGQVVAPHVALGPPDKVGQRGVAADDDGIDPWRRRDERLGDGNADLGRRRGVERARLAEVGERSADAAHNVAALDRDLARERRGDRRIDRRHRVGRQVEAGEALGDDTLGSGDRRVVVERGVGVGGLEWEDLRVPVAAVGGDDDTRAGVVDAVAERLVAEPAEHRRVDDAEPLGGLRPIDLRRDRRHVERDAVAGFEPQPLQRHRALGGFEQQLLARYGIGVDRRAAAAVGRHVPAVALEDQRRLGAMAGEHVAVDLGEAGVGPAAGEPLEERRVAGVERGRPRYEIGAQVGDDRRGGDRVPARPAALGEAQPSPVRPDIAHEPRQLACRVGVERAGIGEDGGAHRLPVGARADRIGRGDRRPGG